MSMVMAHPTTRMATIGELIRELREERNWSQAHIGSLIDMSANQVSKRENGDIRIKAHERKLWAAVFGMSLEEFTAKLYENQRVHERQAPVGIPIINKAPAGVVMDYEEAV